MITQKDVHVLWLIGTPPQKKNRWQNTFNKSSCFWDLPGFPVVKNLPANAGQMSSVPGPGRTHMP